VDAAVTGAVPQLLDAAEGDGRRRARLIEAREQTVEAQANIKKTVAKLSLLVLGMSGFGFALVPLYDLLCEVTGLGGKTGGPYSYEAAEARVDRSRLVKVNFVTNTNAGMPWEFWSEKGGVRVHPGELKTVNFYVKNTTNRRMVGQAVPSVVPLTATDYFHKTECFCFNHQVLEPGEELEMPMRFIVDADLPPNVKSISLSYALFDISEFAPDALEDGPSPATGD
jgi:cytochrome c oxidase assembly protein subunit 11